MVAEELACTLQEVAERLGADPAQLPGKASRGLVCDAVRHSATDGRGASSAPFPTLRADSCQHPDLLTTQGHDGLREPCPAAR